MSDKPMTTRQLVSELVQLAEDAEGTFVGNTIHAKTVAIKAYTANRIVFGKRPFRYEVKVDGQPWGWQPNKNHILTELWKDLDPVVVEERKEREQRFAREAQERREREEQERIRLEPLREQCRLVVRETLKAVVEANAPAFTAAEVHEAFRGAVYNVLHEQETAEQIKQAG